MRSKALQIGMTWRTSMTARKKSMDPPPQDHHPSSVQIVQHWSLTEKILERWAEHFNSILNCPSTINDEAIDQLPQVPFDEMLDVVPTFEEIWKAIHLLTSGKAPGADSIPAEVYKEGGKALTEKLHQLFQLIWHYETVPQDFKEISFHLYKCKGNWKACDNHHGISLLFIAGRPWLEFYSTASFYILREVSYQRASAASGENAGLSTWCLLLDSSRRNVRNRMLTYTPPMLIWPRPLTLSAEMAFGESWQNTDAPRNLLPLYTAPWWHAG